MSDQTEIDEPAGIDPNHPAMFQRGFAGRVIPSGEEPGRRARRAREQRRPEALPPAESIDFAEPATSVAADPIAPEPTPAVAAPVRPRTIVILTLIAAANVVAGLAASWTGSTISYQQWNDVGGTPSVEDTVVASLLSTAGPAFITVGLAGLAAILVWLSVRGRR
jgi:hypothetical protein